MRRLMMIWRISGERRITVRAHLFLLIAFIGVNIFSIISGYKTIMWIDQIKKAFEKVVTVNDQLTNEVKLGCHLQPIRREE